MSVEYKAGLALGWKVTEEERTAMLEIEPDYEDCFICVDDRTEAGYVFGEWCQTIEPGTARPVDVYDILHSISFNFEAYHKYLLLAMGREDLVNVPPKFFLVHQIY